MQHFSLWPFRKLKVLVDRNDTEEIQRLLKMNETRTKEMLDDMHKRKIDMADEIYVINVGGYIGDSTRSEIEYARKTGMKVRYLE